ncbi:hypothetical protein Tco_0426319 [Tanacetum coccineum]
MTPSWVGKTNSRSSSIQKFTLDYDSQMTNKYFVETTGIEVKHFRDILLQHPGNVKKSVAERTRHQRQTDSTVQDDNNRSGNDTDANDADIRPIYDEEQKLRFSPNKTSAVYEKTSPRSDLRWKTTGRILKSVGLRWIPTGKLFDSCTSKVDSELPHGLNVDIPNIHECKQTLDVSAGTSINVQKEQSLDLSTVNANNIDLLVQQYEQFSILEDESIDVGFAKFNTIVTSLKALAESFSSNNYVRNLLRSLHPKWRAKVTAIEEYKDLSSLSLDELIGNSKSSSEEDVDFSGNCAMRREHSKSIGMIRRNENALDAEIQITSSENVQSHPETKIKRHSPEDYGVIAKRRMKKRQTCFMAQPSNEVRSNSSYYSDENPSIDDDTLQDKYNKICQSPTKAEPDPNLINLDVSFI